MRTEDRPAPPRLLPARRCRSVTASGRRSRRSRRSPGWWFLPRHGGAGALVRSPPRQARAGMPTGRGSRSPTCRRSMPLGRGQPGCLGRPAASGMLLTPRDRAGRDHARAGLSSTGDPELTRAAAARATTPSATVAAVRSARSGTGRGRVVLVGTGGARPEGAPSSMAASSGPVRGDGPRDRPRVPARVVDGLLTEFHEPPEPPASCAPSPSAAGIGLCPRRGRRVPGHEFGDSSLILEAA